MAKGYTKVVCGCLFPFCLLMALVTCGVAVTLWLVFPSVLTSQVAQKVTVEKGSATYEQLQNLTLPLWKSFYFFNLTNIHKFDAGEKPILEQVGPYSYREYRTKDFVEFSSDKETLTYTQQKVFYFDQDATGPNLTETDTICTINIPFIAGADQVENSFIMREAYKVIVKLSGAHLYVCQQATHLAWNYTDKLVQDLHAVHKYPRTYVNIQVNNSINDTLPSIIRTGVGDINSIGEFLEWDGHQNMLDTWEPAHSVCNMIRGTEGLFFHPNLKEGDNLTAFVDDVQRSFDLQYIGKVSHLGVNAFRYVLADHTFFNKSKYPQNKCWGPTGSEGNYTPEGLFYLGPTQYPEIPIYGSNPHFYGGDPSLLDCIEGLDPTNSSDDITMIDVEPITGANIQLKKNLQLNVRVNKYKMTYLEDIKCVGHGDAYFYPVLWLSEHAELTPEFKQYLEDKGLKEVAMFNIIVPVAFGLLLALGALLLFISLCTCCCFIRTTRKSLAEERQPLLHVNTDP